MRKPMFMPEKTYNNLKHGSLPPLKKTNTVLISFSKHKLNPIAAVVLTTRYKDQVEDVRFFFMPGLELVLSGNTCIKLGLLKRVHQITSKNPRARVELDDFPELLTGLGCPPDSYHVELAESTVPVVHPPRKVPVPQREKVIEELKRTEKVGVIVRQEEPAE